MAFTVELERLRDRKSFDRGFSANEPDIAENRIGKKQAYAAKNEMKLHGLIILGEIRL